MSTKYSQFVMDLTNDPDEREVLKRLLHSLGNKYKVKMTAEKLPLHDREVMRMTATFLNRPALIKSFFVIVMTKLRYQSPDNYAAWISDLSNNFEDALLMRLRFKPTQTYKALGDYIAGLNRFEHGSQLTAEQKSCLLAASYVTNSPTGVIVSEEAFFYDWDENYVRLADCDLVTYICENPEKASMIREIIIKHLVLRPAEIESALIGDTSTLLVGSL
jgi:hypothetical protein